MLIINLLLHFSFFGVFEFVQFAVIINIKNTTIHLNLILNVINNFLH